MPAIDQEARDLGTQAVAELLTAENKGDLDGFPEFLGRLADLAERFEKFRDGDEPYARRATKAWDQILGVICSSCGLVDPRTVTPTSMRLAQAGEAVFAPDPRPGDYVLVDADAMPGLFDADAIAAAAARDAAAREAGDAAQEPDEDRDPAQEPDEEGL